MPGEALPKSPKPTAINVYTILSFALPTAAIPLFDELCDTVDEQLFDKV